MTLVWALWGACAVKRSNMVYQVLFLQIFITVMFPIYSVGKSLASDTSIKYSFVIAITMNLNTINST